LGGEHSDQGVLRFGERGIRMAVSRDAVIRPTGRVVFEGGAVEVAGTFVNEGVIEVFDSAGLEAGRFHNMPSGSILVTDGSFLHLAGDTINAGHFTLAPSATLQTYGDWEGRGTEGAGQVTIRGDLLPGIGVGEQSFGGNLVLEAPFAEATSQVFIQIAGTRARQEHDVLRTGGTFTFGGLLDVLLDGELASFEPSIGDSFTVVEAQGGVEGRFTSISVPSPNWAIDYSETAVRLEILDPAGRGDYNGDGRIDQADLDLSLLSWGDTGGADRLASQWTHYLPVGVIGQTELDAVLLGWGQTRELSGQLSGDAPTSPIPEPPTTILAMLSGLIAALYGRRAHAR
jgi:hypothetical protein